MEDKWETAIRRGRQLHTRVSDGLLLASEEKTTHDKLA